MNKVILMLVLVLAVGFGNLWAHEGESHAESGKVTEQKAVYACPMHPQIQKDAPGECPICGMTLEKAKGNE